MAQLKANLVSVYVVREGQRGIELLLLQRPQDYTFPGDWQAVHGHIEEGETAWQAALREVREETALQPRRWFRLFEVETFYNPENDTVYLVPTFMAEADRQAQCELSPEHRSHVWRLLPEARAQCAWETLRSSIDALTVATEKWPHAGAGLMELDLDALQRRQASSGGERQPALRQRQGPAVPALGIIGVERSGKTSLLNAVTGSDHPVGFATHLKPHVGVVKVPDSRLDQLSAHLRPKKSVPAEMEYVDFPGAGFREGQEPEAEFLSRLSGMDGLIHVVRAFENEVAPHPHGDIDPARDIEAMALELTFADLALAQKRLGRIATDSKALKASEREAPEREAALLRRLESQLSDGVAVRAQPLSPDERKALRQYRFLTDRPLLTLLNIDEGDAARAAEIAAAYRPAQEPPGTAIAAVCASLEMELRSLSAGEAAEYRRSVGATEGALELAVRLSHQILGLITFFTTRSRECHAWTLDEGANAQQAAGRIHSDMARGFIRTDVINWRDLIEAGTDAEARKRALLRTEGKDYVVQDGDVLHILFNV